jgi:16S rRNA (guanine966-N2)-methyltransferase
MRIRAGRFRGIQVTGKSRHQIRPTTDKNREWIFQFLDPYLDGTKFLDLFAGTGVMGIEALSRGCSYSVFVDNNTGPLIRKNIRSLGSDLPLRIFSEDVLRFLRRRHPARYRFQIINADPPYDFDSYDDLISEISKSKIWDVSGLLILESGIHSNIMTGEMPLSKIREKKFGDTRITIFKRGDT